MSFWYPQFSQKTNEKIRLYYYGTSSRIVFVHFLGELIPKRHLEINWTLGILLLFCSFQWKKEVLIKTELYCNKSPFFQEIQICKTKDKEGKDRRRQLLYYVSLIRACNKVLYQLVYIGKKFVFLKKNLGI